MAGGTTVLRQWRAPTRVWSQYYNTCLSAGCRRNRPRPRVHFCFCTVTGNAACEGRVGGIVCDSGKRGQSDFGRNVSIVTVVTTGSAIYLTPVSQKQSLFLTGRPALSILSSLCSYSLSASVPQSSLLFVDELSW